MSFADIIMPLVGIFLLGVNFFFVLAEFAMVRVRASRIAEIKEAMLLKHIPMIEEAGRKGVQILCLQEIFITPYF